MKEDVILRDLLVSDNGGKAVGISAKKYDCNLSAGGMFNPSLFFTNENQLVCSVRHAPQMFFFDKNCLDWFSPICALPNVKSEIYYTVLDKDCGYTGKEMKNLFPGLADSLPNNIKSIEDFRFSYCDSKTISGYGVVPSDGYKEIKTYYLSTDLESDTFSFFQIKGQEKTEKNWMPVLSDNHKDPDIIYKPGNIGIPCSLGDIKNKKLCLRNTLDGLHFRGSSQVIPYKEGYIGVLHYAEGIPTIRQLQYKHLFAKFDRDFNIVSLSKPFLFEGFDIEFCCGIADIGDSICLSYSILDSYASLLFIEYDFIEQLLKKDVRSSLRPELCCSRYEKKIDYLWNNGMFFPCFNLCQYLASKVSDKEKSVEYYIKSAHCIEQSSFPNAYNQANIKEHAFFRIMRQIMNYK